MDECERVSVYPFVVVVVVGFVAIRTLFYKSMSGKKVLFLLLGTTSGDNQRSVSNICSDLVIVSSFKQVSKNSSIVMTPS